MTKSVVRMEPHPSQLQEALYPTRQNYYKKLVAVHIQLALEGDLGLSGG